MYMDIFGRENSAEKNDKAKQMRYSIFRSIGMIKCSIERLEREKEEILSSAREAKRTKDESAYASAKKRLSLCLVNGRLLKEMLSQLEILLEIDNMDRMIESYNSCMTSFRKRHSLVQSAHGAIKNANEAKNELAKAGDYYNELYESLSREDRGFGSRSENAIPDSELEQIIGEEGKGCDSRNEELIDQKIQLIRKRMKEIEDEQ